MHFSSAVSVLILLTSGVFYQTRGRRAEKNGQMSALLEALWKSTGFLWHTGHAHAHTTLIFREMKLVIQQIQEGLGQQWCALGFAKIHSGHILTRTHLRRKLTNLAFICKKEKNNNSMRRTRNNSAGFVSNNRRSKHHSQKLGLGVNKLVMVWVQLFVTECYGGVWQNERAII